MQGFSQVARLRQHKLFWLRKLQRWNCRPPRTDGGKPLIQALGLRRSIREYADKPLAAQVLSDLLWAAFGINRPAMGDRTAPYWRHVMVIDIYAAMADGVWLYEPKRHALLPHLRTDIRAQTGLQDFVGTALSILSTSLTVSACKIFPPRTDAFTHRSIPVLSGRTSTCSAPRKAWPPSFEVGRLRQA